ncbi:MAG: UDP-N-acetylmuramoyl-L-alanine--D-glutamate ligase [Gammaproteobacteria bacterium]|nr:UDP-N-acetylmuramoyl-L-alanine--D-glutamate ligase [Gammaproteobacteria bacterium]
MIETGKQFNTVVVGLGKTGFACARYLAAQGISFAVTDNRDQPPMLNEMKATLPDVPLCLGGFDETLLMSADHLLLSPGVSLQEDAIVKAIDSGAEVYGDIELFCRNITAPVIAITGSNGKSTVTTMVAEMARAANLNVVAGGNLGTPALDLLGDNEPDVYVLELSSFQLETVSSLNATASVVLNVSPDHMDRYEGLTEYKTAKERIYDGNGTIVINLDDPASASMARNQRTCVGFTLFDPLPGDYGVRDYDGERWIVKGNDKLIPVNDLRIKGEHNIANAMAAMALAETLSCPAAAMLTVLRSFPGLEHRCQWIAEHEDVKWFNDSKGTNVGASCAAIKGLSADENIVLIAGGEGKGADFSELEGVAEGRLKAAIVLGKDGPEIGKALVNVVPVHAVDSMEMAVETAARIARAGDIVLLSPACASLDMFENYQARGDAFVAAVKNVLGDQCHV